MTHPTTATDEVQSRALIYRGNEQAWRFINDQWKTNDQGDIICPALSHWSMQTHLAFSLEHAYRDCTVRARWQYLSGGGASPELIVRAQDSRRYYAVRFNLQMNLPSEDLMIMCSIWKSCGDGYARMLGYRRKVGVYDNKKAPHKWHKIKVICAGPEVVVYFEGNFVCAVRDDEYGQGVIGVSGGEGGSSAWQDLTVSGQPVTLEPSWSVVDEDLPRQIEPVQGTAMAGAATLLPDDEILVGYQDSQKKQLLIRSRDYGLTWDEPVEGRFGQYIKSHHELWSIWGEHNPDVVWTDQGTNFDELNSDNFWTVMVISKDHGRTWSGKQRLDLPFPKGLAYAPIKGKSGAVVGPQDSPRVLSDGSVALSACWRNNPDGNYHSDQVQFCRTSDGGQTWSMVPVDNTEWERNESTWVELDDGQILMLLRSNYTNSVGASWSNDLGRTWTRVRPLGIPYFGASAPAIIRTRDNVLVVATRIWGIFTSIDDGQTWSQPTHVLGYTGEGAPANIFEMSDGRIFLLSSDHGNARDRCRMKMQFIRVDRDGSVHPAPPGPPA